MPRLETPGEGRTSSPELYRPLPPLVDKPPLSKPEPAIPWPAIPSFQVVEEEPEYDDDPRPHRRRPEPTAGRSRDYGEGDDVRHPNYWKREVVGNWQTVASGLNTMLFGTLLGLFGMVVTFIVVFPLLHRPGTSPHYGYGYGPNGPLGFLCFSGTCLTVSGLLYVIGQGMCCAAPANHVRNRAVVSLVLGLISILLMVVQIMVWSNFSRLWYQVGPAFPTVYLLPGLLAWIMGAISHCVFAKFLQDVARHFREPSTARQTSIYLVVCAIFFGVNFFLVFLSVLPTQNSGLDMGWGRSSSNFEGLFGTCFGCIGLFIFIALVSLLYQTRSLIKDRLTAGKGRLPLRHDWEDMAE